MGDALDRISKALASGASRRSTLGGLLAGSVALPWTAEAKKRRKRKNKRKKFKKYQEFCRQWCGEKFGFTGKAFNNCVDKAKEGKGPCYSSTSQGPGYFCREVLKCGEQCCPDVNTGGGPVTDGECCTDEETCELLNGASFFCIGSL